jgi:hypothetical protein
MQSSIIDFGTGVIIGGLALSACWGLWWLIVGTVGYARGFGRPRVVMNSVAVGVSPLLLAWGLWWMRADALSSRIAFVGGLFVMPLLLTGLSLRRASDGRRVGQHMVEGIRHLRDELLGTHHECGGCDHDHDADTAGRCS